MYIETARVMQQQVQRIERCVGQPANSLDIFMITTNLFLINGTEIVHLCKDYENSYSLIQLSAELRREVLETYLQETQ